MILRQTTEMIAPRGTGTGQGHQIEALIEVVRVAEAWIEQVQFLCFIIAYYT